MELTRLMIQHYDDAERGGFFQTADDGEALPVRPREGEDQAIPSGNSIAALNLARLARITGDETFSKKSEETLNAFAGGIAASPDAFTQMLQALDFNLGQGEEIVIAGRADAKDARAMVKMLRTRFLPNTVVLFRPEGAADSIIKIAPFTQAMTAREGRATAYICVNQTCQAPISDIAAFEKALDAPRR